MRNYFKYLAYLIVVIGASKALADSYVDYFRAVNVDNASGVEELLARGFDPNTLSTYGQTGLYLAIRDDSPKVAAVLMASPALKVDLANFAGETALMMAALRGNLELTKKLIGMGAKVQREGWTPLHYAATGPNVEVVALLLDLGGEIDARAPNGNTPLMMAARFGDEESVKLLLKRGADKKLLNDRNQSAADLARVAERPWLLPLLQ
jgi:ankyrin repeat protein